MAGMRPAVRRYSGRAAREDRAWAVFSRCARSFSASARVPGLRRDGQRDPVPLPRMDRPASCARSASRRRCTMARWPRARRAPDRGCRRRTGPAAADPAWSDAAVAAQSATGDGTRFGLAEERARFRQDNVLADAHVPFRHERGSEEPAARPLHQADDVRDLSPLTSAVQPGVSHLRTTGAAASPICYRTTPMRCWRSGSDAKREKIVEHLFRALTASTLKAAPSAVPRPWPSSWR